MKYGDIIELGRHRLMCGDATLREDVMKLVDGARIDLVLTDPPYGIKSVNEHSQTIGGKHTSNLTAGKMINARKYTPVTGDENTDTARRNYEVIKNIARKFIIWGGQNFTDFLPPSYGWIFWDKERNTDKLSFSDGKLAYANTGTRIRKYSHKWNGFLREGRKDLNEKIHPSQKPIELHMKILEDFSKPDDVILDCFGGSGTTLLACELTGRRCLMMEISPDYCDIIKDRYEKLTEGRLPLG